MGAPVDGKQHRGRGPSRYKYNTRRIMHIREARDLARKFLSDAKYIDRIQNGLRNGTLHPLIEKAWMEIAEYFPKKGAEVHLNIGIGGEGAGLINMVVQGPIDEDPLAKAKPIGSGKTDKALPPKMGESIIPPSRPASVRVKSKAPPLGPDEGVMS